MSRLISIALAIFFACMTAVLAAPLNLDGDGVAIQGYDPVANFEMVKSVEGMASIAVEYEGAHYRFSTEANRAAFEANPERYAPAYGVALMACRKAIRLQWTDRLYHRR
jgi:YHS domain-containing protein